MFWLPIVIILLLVIVVVWNVCLIIGVGSILALDAAVGKQGTRVAVIIGFNGFAYWLWSVFGMWDQLGRELFIIVSVLVTGPTIWRLIRNDKDRIL